MVEVASAVGLCSPTQSSVKVSCIHYIDSSVKVVNDTKLGPESWKCIEKYDEYFTLAGKEACCGQSHPDIPWILVL